MLARFFSRAVLPLGVTLAFLTAGCSKKENSDEIVIGEVASLTGGTAAWGKAQNDGVKMAVEEINAAGGLLGKKVKLLTEDDQSKNGEAGTVTKKLVSREKVVGMLGEISSSKSLEMAPICQKEGVPMISPGSTNTKVTEVGDFIFRVCFIDPFQGTVMAKFALSKGWKNMAVLTDVKEDYSVGLSQFFKEYYSKNGGHVAVEQSFSKGDKDFKSQLTAIKAANVDAIFLPGYYTEIGLIAKQARELGITVPMCGGDGWDDASLMQVAGSAVDGCFFSNHFSTEDKSEAIQTFVKKYEAARGTKPSTFVALGYDAAMLLFHGIKTAGTTDGKAVRDVLAKTKDFPAITGSITLDEKRNATKAAVILTIDKGEVKYVETVQP
ncbi:MAG: ABC transporter substrate-binding protein [Verrucomicrobiaceae bacterium]|nr:MAG: ABC transporter substrate-binding protein [Verrucomicrobiaceae bacterium]